MITQSQYDEITRYKELIENCSSNKEARGYLEKLKFLSNYVEGPARNILSELCSSLNEYCKRGSDKEHWVSASKHGVVQNSRIPAIMPTSLFEALFSIPS